MRRHQLQRRLSDLKPLSGFEHELRQTLSVEPRPVGAASITDADLSALKKDLGVATRRLRIVEDDVTRLSSDGCCRRADVSRLGRSIDVLDLENVVAAHSFLRGEWREFRNAATASQA
jgi:hypothetical protein